MKPDLPFPPFDRPLLFLFFDMTNFAKTNFL